MNKQQSPYGAPKKGAPLFGPDVWKALGWSLIGLLAVTFFLAILKEPAVRANLVGLWLKFWYGEGLWEVARYVVWCGGFATLWIVCDVLEHARKKERYSDDR